jgi:hypothetical protein
VLIPLNTFIIFGNEAHHLIAHEAILLSGSASWSILEAAGESCAKKPPRTGSIAIACIPLLSNSSYKNFASPTSFSQS